MDEGLPAPQQSSRTAFIAKFFNQMDHYKRLLKRYWWISLITVAASLGIESYLLKHVRQSYVTTSKMITGVKVNLEKNIFSEDAGNFFGNQVALMQGETVQSRVNAFMRSNYSDLNPIPVDFSVSVSPKTSIFLLRAQGENPKFIQAYLDAVMSEYINLKKDLLVHASDSTQTRMKDELKQVGVELQKAEKDVHEYEASNKVVFLQPSGGNSAADYFAKLSREIDELKQELQVQKSLTLDQKLEREQENTQGGTVIRQAEANGTANQKNSRNKGGLNPSGIGEGLNGDAAIGSVPINLGEFETSYITAKDELILLRAKYSRITNSNPKLRLDAPELRDLREAIKTQEMNMALYKQQSEEDFKNKEIRAELKIQSLEEMAKEAETNALTASRSLAAYEALKENRKQLQEKYDKMAKDLQTLAVDGTINPDTVEILWPASWPEYVPLEKSKHMVMGGLIGLLLGVGIMVVLDRLNDCPSTFAELEQLFDMPVLGQFPLMKPKDKKDGVKILQANDDRYPLIEAYRNLRSALLYKESPEQHPRSIVITSARPNDGKSMVSANFAITLAQTGARVLLIDADLRRGVLHKHFCVTSSPGFAEVLSNECPWEKAVIPTPIKNLSILPCGKSPRHPGNLFPQAGKFLEEIAGHYDYYLFDTAPVMVGDDVLSLAPHVDGLLMVIRAGFTSGRMAQTALDLLQVRQVNVIGLVFNGVHPKASGYYYYRFKEYYPPHTES